MVTTRPAPGQLPQQREATSGADGTFRFDDLGPGAYRLTVRKSGFVNPGSRDMLNPPPTIRIEAGKPSPAALLTLERGAVIAGRVLSPNGQPVSETRLGVFRRSQRAPGGPLMMAGPPATTHDLGEFRLHSLPAGEYFVQAGPRPTSFRAQTAPSKTMIAPTFYPGTTDPATAQPLSVGGGATLNGIEIALLEVPAFSVRGTVVDEVGRPVKDASIVLMADPAMGVTSLFAGQGRAQTSADGQFRIDGVAAGVYFANAAAPLVAKSNSSGAERGTISGLVGSLGNMTESYTRDGVTTTYRFDQSGQVRVTVQGGDTTDLRLIAR